MWTKLQLCKTKSSSHVANLNHWPRVFLIVRLFLDGKDQFFYFTEQVQREACNSARIPYVTITIMAGWHWWHCKEGQVWIINQWFQVIICNSPAGNHSKNSKSVREKVNTCEIKDSGLIEHCFTKLCWMVGSSLWQISRTQLWLEPVHNWIYFGYSLLPW